MWVVDFHLVLPLVVEVEVALLVVTVEEQQ
jgi:hypothetical protein